MSVDRRALQVIVVTGVWLAWCAVPLCRSAEADLALHRVADRAGHFSYTETALRDGPGYRVRRLVFPSPVTTASEANNQVPAEYYLPSGASPTAPRPAVVCLHILNGNFELVRLLCTVLAREGVPAMMFALPYYGERGAEVPRRELLRDAERFAAALEQAIADTHRARLILASRDEVDGDRIGVSGISLGAILAGTAAGQGGGFHRAALILGGGDVLRITRDARETRDLRQFLDALPADRRAAAEAALTRCDPLTHAAGLRPLAADNRLMMINAAEDKVVPPVCTRALARAAGLESVTWLEGLGHYTAMAAVDDILRQTAAFFARDLPPAVRDAAPGSPQASGPWPPPVALSRLAGQLASLLGQAPRAGHCHMADIAVEVAPADGASQRGTLRFIRGSGGRFRLSIDISRLGQLQAGQDDVPWVLSAGENPVVFRGSVDPVETTRPLQFAAQDTVMKIRTVTGLLAAAALAPGALDEWVSMGPVDGREWAYELTSRQEGQGSGRLELHPDGRPKSLRLSMAGGSGQVTFRRWRLNAPALPALFLPPPDVPEQPVRQEDVFRIYAGVADFLVEMGP